MNSATDTRLEIAAKLRLALVRTARRLRREAGSGLSPSLSVALGTIERHGPLTPSELAEREGIKRPAASRIVARLEAGGLIDRAADPDDGRAALIAIAAPGRELLAETRARRDEYLASRLRDLPDEDVAALARAAEVLERLLEDGRR